MSQLETIIEDLSNLSIEGKENPLTDSTQSSKKLLEIPLVTKEEVNSLSIKILSSFNMAQFKPEYLKCVPEFDGNPNDLNRYLSTCQSLIDNFYNSANQRDFQNVFLLNSLIGKLTGTAKIIVNIQNVTTWDDLKAVLHRNFADQRDESCLNRDLVMLKQNSNESPNQFYDRILHLLNLLCSYIDSHENSDAGRILKKGLYNDLALKTFLSGLKEPLGTTIRCMKPNSLAEALQYVTQEHNNNYFQNFARNQPQNFNKSNSRPQPVQQFRTPFLTQPQHHFSSFNSQTPYNLFTPRPQIAQTSQFPSQPINIRPNFNKIPQRFSTNSRVFGRPNQSNVFKPNQNRPLPNPQPMSVCTSGPKGPLVPTNRFQRPNPQNNQPKYLVEELYNTEMQPNFDYDQYDQFNQYGLSEQYSSEVTDYYANPNTLANSCENDEENAEYTYSQNFLENPTLDNNTNVVDPQEQNTNFQVTPQIHDPI